MRDGVRTSVEKGQALAADVSCTTHELSVTLVDGRIIFVPLAWFPRLLEATQKQRAEWELIGGGIGIHWDAIDEDISVASLLHPENFVSLPHERMQPTRERPGVQARRRRARG